MQSDQSLASVAVKGSILQTKMNFITFSHTALAPKSLLDRIQIPLFSMGTYSDSVHDLLSYPLSQQFPSGLSITSLPPFPPLLRFTLKYISHSFSAPAPAVFPLQLLLFPDTNVLLIPKFWI